MEIDAISLYEPACGEREIQLVTAVLESARWGDGPMLESFERAFAGWAGRRHAVAVGSGTLGTWIALRAYGIGPATRWSAAATPGTRWRRPSRSRAPRRCSPTSTTGPVA
jgi:Predicted pyridoxal phosphate-dependent enzyme apparently involved in regulation of cell wall biogenesis